jgi:dihydrofolate reductase
MNAKRKSAKKATAPAKPGRRVRYSVAMSLDGYVAGTDGEYDWIVMDPDFDFEPFMSSIDTLLIGRKTYEASKAMGGGAGMPGVKAFVVSRTLRQEDHPDVTIIGDDLEGAVDKLRNEPGKDIWLFGGGELFRSLLDLGLVDSVEIGVIPVLLGGGAPLLPATSQRASLKLINSRVYQKTGTVSLEYAVRQ